MHHVSIRTRDLAAAQAFYRILGFVLESSYTASGQRPACWLTSAHGRLELTQIASDRASSDSLTDPGHVGYDHLALVIDHLDDMLTTLRAAGAREIGAVVSRVMNGRTYRVGFIRDPEDLLLELIEEGPPAGAT
jgi:catechol 2,3-dioxygenase-like lactoylglutathione lyase family enzyme